MDVRGRTWFGLQDQCSRQIEIEQQDTPQRFALEMTSEDVQVTLERLASTMDAMGKKTGEK
jgi:hypothetical protein